MKMADAFKDFEFDCEIMQIREVITEFHFDCQVLKLSPKTIRLYDCQLEYLAAYMERMTGITNIEEVRSIHIKKFLVDKADAGRKPQYINDQGFGSTGGLPF